MRRYSVRFLQLTLIAFLSTATLAAVDAQDSESFSVLDDEGRLVQFERDVAPIFRDRCLECHGPEEAKSDFRIDDAELLMDYIEAEDAESSVLYTDYLVIDDADMIMPPLSKGGPLSSGELAVIRLWINEGAHWPEGYQLKAKSDGEAEVEPEPKQEAEAPKTLGDRIWVFQGYLHPATVHFPIALFLLGGAFVVFGWKWPSVGTQIPLACLLIGTLTAVSASAMGWAFAPIQGYGDGWSLFDWEREVNVHRMSGAISTIIAVVISVVALMALWKDSEKLTRIWKIGLLALAAMIGLVGHQGGELRYGKDFYPEAFRILLGTNEDAEATDAADTESEAAADEAEAGQGSDAESPAEESAGSEETDAQSNATSEPETAESSE